MDQVKLSVIMPTYNSDQYVEKSMFSLLRALNQEYCEIICIDDGSQDETVEKLNRFAQKYSMIKVIANKHIGVSATRNIGIKLAIGDYVVFVDSDDLFEPNFYENFNKQLKDKPDIILEDVKGIDREKFKTVLTDHERLEVMKINLRFGKVSLSWGIGSRIYNRSLLQKNNLLFDSSIIVSEDMLFIMEAISKADSILISPQRFYHLQGSHTLFRFNPQNLQSEVHFRRRVASLMNDYHDSLARDINNRTKLTGFIFLIDSYFGPLYNKKKLTLCETTKNMKSVAEDYFYDTSFSEKKFDKFLSRKAPTFRRLLRMQQYGMVLILNRMIDSAIKVDRGD